jgi:dephospho-CoA kinase
MLDRLRFLGAAVIRADEVYQKLLRTDDGMCMELKERFPNAFTKDGAFDRAAMRGIAFSDSGALADLNRITHPHVIKEIRRNMAQAFIKDSGAPIAIEAIALIGSGLDMLCTARIAVTAPYLKRAERIMLRDGLASEEAMKRLRNQKDDGYYIANCDITIENNGTEDELTAKVDELWKTRVIS